jgi:hypothetical protein
MPRRTRKEPAPYFQESAISKDGKVKQNEYRVTNRNNFISTAEYQELRFDSEKRVNG